MVGKYLPAINTYAQSLPAWVVGLGTLVALVVVLTLLFLKGYALWLSARRGERWWFVAILILNTLGILEIIYLVKHRAQGGEQAPSPTTNWS